MKKITATIIKEYQLMRRDVGGLLLLLIMPAAMIIIMALVQDAPFRDYQELSFDLLVADLDHGSFSAQVTGGLKTSKNFHIIDSVAGQPLDETTLKRLLNKGKYKIGIVIPAGVTAEMVNSANLVVNNIAQKAGIEVIMPTREVREQAYVRLLFDPVAKPAFRTAISSGLDKYITYASTNILLQRLSILGKTGTAPAGDADQLKKVMQGIGLREVPLYEKRPANLHINSVQHNVPAWAIFGMFFIAIPIAGSIIKEREDSSALRIRLIPNATRFVTMGKIIFYTLICALQFMVMMAIGLWAMPLFGLPALYPGMHAWLLLPVALCIGFAATAYGIFTGTAFRTITRALPFGSVSIVILSALGGIWVPIEILPPGMRVVALASPLHWALDAVNQVILRDGDATTILLPMSVLLLTGAILWLAANYMNIRSKKYT